VIGVGFKNKPFKKKKKNNTKKKKKKKKKTWPSAPSAAKNSPCTPVLAPRSRSGAARAAWPVM
jgi:hypothetical protein